MLYLALFLLFHQSFIPQTFIVYLCVLGSLLGAGDMEGRGLCFLGASGSCLAFFSVLQRQRLYANGCNGISPPSFAPGYQSSCPFFPFSIQTAPFRSSKPKSDGSRCGDFYIFVNNHLTLQNVREKMNLLEDYGVESLEEQSQGHSGAS